MRVADLIAMLSRYSPDTQVCALYWDKELFDYDKEDETHLTDEAWGRICREFDETEELGASVTEWIRDAALEYSSDKSV